MRESQQRVKAFIWGEPLWSWGWVQKQRVSTILSGGKLPSVAEEDEKPSEQRSWFSMEEGSTAQFYLHRQHRQTPGTPVRLEPPGVAQWESAGFLQGKDRGQSEAQQGPINL